MGTKVVFFTDKGRLSSYLTYLFTGCYIYHVGFLVGDYFYDMNWMRRRVKWMPTQYADDQIEMIDSPVEVSEEFLINKILNENVHYSLTDYLFFFFRSFGRKVKNTDGLICSEQVNNDLIENGWDSPWSETAAPPSPCDLYKALVH
jgi:hypothetical protein